MGRGGLALLLAIATLPLVLLYPSGVALAGPPPVFTMYVPLEDQQVSTALITINGNSTNGNVVSTIDITSAADNSVVYWDHWEDGYEADIANPVQSTTQVWGDNNAGNGSTPGAATDDVDAGTVIFLQNTVPLPRNTADIRFDGRDKVASTRGFALTRAGWDEGLGTVHAGAVAATDLSKFGTQFDIPVGENMGLPAFNYTGLGVLVSDNNTFIEIDTDGDGDIDQSFTRNEGETVFFNGGISSGASVQTSKPSQVHIITGERGATWEGRWFEIFPEEIRGDEYVAAAGSTSATQQVTVFLHNPGATTINVAVDAQGTANDTNITLAPGVVSSYDLPNASGARFSSPGNPFTAISGTVANVGTSATFDWGYSLLATSELTPGVVVGWGQGNPSGEFNHSPIWVAPLADTVIYADFDADGTPDDIGGGTFDDDNDAGTPDVFGLAVTAFQSVKIADGTDFDSTGSRIYTTDGTLISVAWGQDPAAGECCNAYDLGTPVLPSTSLVTTKSADIAVDLNSDGRVNPGDTLEYTIHSVDAGALSLTNIVVLDTLPPTLSYVPNSTYVDGVNIADDAVGTTVFPLDEAGVTIPVLTPGSAVDVRFRTELANPFPSFVQQVRNEVMVSADQASSTATSIVPVEIPDLYIAKTGPTAPLLPGEQFDYSIEVSNVSLSAQTGIDVTDMLPLEVSWDATSVSRPIDDPSPAGSLTVTETWNTPAYDNDAASWVTDWVETDANASGTANGDVQIISELGSNRLRMRGGASEIRRTFDATNWDKATVSYDFRRDALEAGDSVSFQISTTGGSSWIELDALAGPATNSAYANISYDITRYVGQNLDFRFVTSNGFDANNDSFYFDNFQIDVNNRILETVAGNAPANLYTNGSLLTGESFTVTVTATVDAGIAPTIDSFDNTASAVSTQNTTPVTSTATVDVARAAVGDVVWHDQDGDGVVDATEPLLAGVTVTLTGGNLPVGGITDVTDSNGEYNFTDLDPDTYTVTVTSGVPAGMAATYDVDGGLDSTSDVTVGFGVTNNDQDFGFAVPVTLGDSVYADLDGDGVEEAGEFGLDGLTVTITGPSHPTGTTTTTNNGFYEFTNLLPGSYDVTVDISPLTPSSYSTTGGNTQTIALTSGNDVDTVDFGYVIPASVGDYIWHDLDADGVQDAGEPALDGVDVTITGPGLPVGGVTTTTDSNGFYLFSNLDAGTFDVDVALGTGDLPATFLSSTGGASASVTLAADEIVDTVDFGFYGEASIGDFVFDDLNGDGDWDTGEPGISGVDVTLDGGDLIAPVTVQTNGSGAYDFTGLTPGAYTVVVDDSGFATGTVNTLNGANPSVTVESTDDFDTADFGYVFPSFIGDFVFDDLDNDGAQDAGEPGLDGITLTLTGGTLPVAGITTTTASGGAYLFSGLAPGDYTVTLDESTLPTGYSLSTTSNTAAANAHDATITSGSDIRTADFGASAPADIGDFIFHDLNADGDFDAGEPALAGVEVTLTGTLTDGTTITPQTDTTDASGNYLFTGLDAGAYTVTVTTSTVPTDYAVTAGNNTRTTTLQSNRDDLDLDFGYATTGAIGDYVWNDLNGDGLQNDGLPSVVGLSGIDVTISGVNLATPITIQTNANGRYLFDTLAPGTYVVTVAAPTGAVNTAGGAGQIVVVESDELISTVDFGYFTPAAAGDLVFDDLNGDGDFDSGETFFAGVTVTLTGSTNDIGGGSTPITPVTDVTDANGIYGFADLAPGDYVVTLTTTDLPSGVVNTLGGTSQAFTITSGNDDLDQDFGFYRPADIGDFVFDDLNGNGTFDTGEPGLDAVTISLLDGTGSVIGTDDTDTNGAYLFADLAPGDYSVRIDVADLDANATVTNPTNGFVVNTRLGTTLTSGTDDLSLDFGVANPITIGDFVFEDLDGDGSFDTGEPGIDNVDVTITGTTSGASHSGGLTIQTTNGNYEFTNLLPGDYDVVVTAPTGYTNTSPLTISDTYESGDDIDTVDFGFRRPASLGDFVFEDLNANGSFDTGESGLAGVTLELSGPGVAPGTEVTTTATGAYTFGNLVPGTFTVTVTDVPAGYTNTVGGANQSTTLVSNETDNTLDFGYYLGASIGDRIFEDTNGNGVDNTDPALAGVVVTLTGGSLPVGGITDTTDATGAYDFTGLTPGTYTVTVTSGLPVGAVNTAAPSSTTFTVVSGDDIDTADFGYYVPATVGDYVWEDLDGDGNQDDGAPAVAGIANVTVTLTGTPTGGSAITPVTDTTDANGAYSFTGLAPGTYSVAIDTTDLAAGAVSSTGGFTVSNFTVESGDDIDTVDFGVVNPSTIGDFVFRDLDGNAAFNGSDVALDNIELTLTGTATDLAGGTAAITPVTITTDASGAYDFAGVLPGTYTVTVTAGSGDLVGTEFATTPVTGPGFAINSIDIESGDDINTVDFGFAEPASIGDTLYEDLNGNGTQDAGEPGIVGVDVTITGPSHPTGNTISTGVSGAYTFTGLAPGSYTVEVDSADPQMDPAFVPTTSANSQTTNVGGNEVQTVVLASSDNVDTVDFGYATPGSIGDFVFLDDNADGNQSGDSGIGGVTVTLTGTPTGGSAITPITDTTDASGAYSFDNLAPGSYTVTVDTTPTGGLPTGSFVTTGSNSQNVAITSGLDVDTVDFGYAQRATIGDFVYVDANGDGAQSGDSGFQGARVTITGTSAGASHLAGFSLLSGPTGAYSFPNLNPGTYTVAVDQLPSGSTVTQGGSDYSITVGSGDVDGSADFGFITPATLGDLVFEDLDGDGTIDGGEPGYDNVTLTLTGSTNDIGGGTTAITPVTTSTDANGAYDFTGLAPGTYTVTVTSGLPAAAVNTLGGTSQTFTITSGEDENTADFGYYEPSTIGDYVWDDLNGDTAQNDGLASVVGLDGVTLTISGTRNDGATFTATTTTTGTDGDYDFTGLAPGTYTITLDTTPTGGLPTGAVVTIGGVTPGSPIVTNIVVTSGSDTNTADFGVALPASLGDFVFQDFDGDGNQDTGDTGFGSVDVTITGTSTGASFPAGTTVSTGTGASVGDYSLGGLLPGTYTVTVNTADLPAGAASSTGGNTQTITLTSGQSVDTIDFGYTLPASIGDQLFIDNNANGTFDTGDVAIAAVDVTLTGPGQPVGGTTIATDTNGIYNFTGLTPGAYTVTVDTDDAQFDAIFTTDNEISSTGGASRSVTVASTDAIDTVDFGFYATGSIGDFVFDDENGNGVDNSDDGIENVTVTLDGGDLAAPITTTTGTGANAGDYLFTGLTPGTYTVTTTIAGMTATTPGASNGTVQTVTIGSGENLDTADFGFVTPAAVGDTIFDDLNGDGVQNGIEGGFDGVDVTITGPGLPVGGLTDITDTNGTYGFSGLLPGTYTVTVDTADLPSAAYGTTTGGDSQNVTLTSGDDNLDVDFGYAAAAAVGDLVFDDLNGDGAWQAGEPGFDNVVVRISGGDLAAPITDTTDAAGDYGFTNLAPGTYTVEIVSGLPTGAVNTLGGTSQTITVVSAEVRDDVDFGYYQPTSIGDLVFTDANDNGTFEAGDTPLENVVVTLTGGSLPVGGITDTTDASGIYGFDSLAPGTYTVTLTSGIPTGAVSSTGGNSTTVTIESGTPDLTADFGLVQNVTIGDFVWHDRDIDGNQDAGEPGLDGVIVNLRNTATSAVVTETSDVNGFYEFTNVAPGPYVVEILAANRPTGFTPTTPAGLPFTVTSGNNIDTADFGLATTATIGDYIWDDLNGNGLQDDGVAGDRGISGITVTLTGGDLVTPVTAVTDADGGYSFPGLTPGDYTVTVTPPTSGTATTAGGNVQTVTVLSDETDNTIDFGYAIGASVGDLVFDDLNGDGARQTGEPGFENVVVRISGGSLAAPITDTTDAAGDYGFGGLAPGTYTVEIVSGLPTGVVNSLGGASQTLTIASGDDVDTVDFGYYRPTSIGDLVFTDANNNSTFGAGDTPLENVVVTLTGGALPVGGITDTTDAGGIYGFDNLAPGTYTVTLTSGIPTGAVSSTGGNATTVTIESGTPDLTADFGLVQNVTIGDFVWHDRDRDGTQEASEPGLDGVIVNLRNTAMSAVVTETTDVDGFYEFTNVAPGSYVVEILGVNLPTGFTPTAPATASLPFTVTSGNNIDTADFGLATTATIGDYIWDDLNGNGLQDDGVAGDRGISGITVTLTGGDLVTPVTAVTDADGGYSFPGLTPGDYTVTVTAPAGATATTAGGNVQTVTVLSEETNNTIDFGYASAASIGDRVFHDLNLDGTQQAGEPGLGGIEVNLNGPGGAQTDTTDGNGDYNFTNLVPGTYTVTVNNLTVPVGAVSGAQLTPTTHSAGSVIETRTVVSGDAVTDADFGYATTAIIGDTVYEDLDADGTQNGLEAGLSGVSVELLSGTVGSFVVESVTTTGTNGAYSFNGVVPGDYTVRIDGSTLPAGTWNATTPALVAVSVTSDDQDLTADFGFAQPATIGDFIWHDLDNDGVLDASEPGLGGITVQLDDGAGTIITTTTSSTPGTLGAYDFTGVAPGTYTVSVDLTSLPIGANSGTTFVAAAGVPTSVSVTVASGDDVDTADFAFNTTATIGDQVWHDLDADGVENDGAHIDAWLDAVVVNLIDPNDGSTVDTQTTTDGAYNFTGIAPGTYEVEVDVTSLPVGYSSTTGNNPTTLTVVSDELVDTVDFGFAQLTGGSIGDEIFDDLNGDGVRQGGEPGLGLTVELFLNTGTPTTPVWVSQGTRVTTGGGYTFGNLAPGQYEVRVVPATVPTNYLPTTTGGLVQGITITSGQSVDTLDFGFVAPATVGDYVWHDLNVDAVQNDGTPAIVGLAGVTVELRTIGGVVVDSDVTGADGSYILSAGPGTYDVVLVTSSLPTGTNSGVAMTPTTSTTTRVTLASNDVRNDVDFGAATTAVIGDTIFDDLDGDGVQDPGEPGISGVTVILDDGGTQVTVVTDTNGVYNFTGVAPGTYDVSVDPSTLPTGAQPTTSATPITVTVVSDELVDNVDLGYVTPGSLSGVVFTDSNVDGDQTGETGVGVVSVELLDENNLVIDTAVTNTDGSYTFSGLLPGDYSVRPILPIGTILTTPNNVLDDTIDSDVLPATGISQVITMTSGANITDIDAGIYELATIGDTVFVDVDGNGVQGPSEPGLPGVTVEVRNDAGTVIGTAVTGANGIYSVDVVPGDLTVSITSPAGYQVTTGSDVQAVSIDSGATNLDVDFGLLGAGSITGQLVYDVSNDGVINPTDPGLGGVPVNAVWTGPNGPVTLTTATNPDGSYSFTSLPPGDYVITIDPTDLPNGIIDPTIDPDGTIDLGTVVTVNGGTVSGVDFGVSGTASLGDNVFIDANNNGELDPGEEGVPGVTLTTVVITVSGPITFTTVSDANGEYQFNDLPAGDYTVTLDVNTLPAGLIAADPTRTTTLVINGQDLSLDLPVIQVVGPTAVPDRRSTPTNTPITITVTDNDLVVPGTSVSVTEITQPTNGTAVLNSDGTVTYTPNLDFEGVDIFTYEICDVTGLDNARITAANRAIFCSTTTVTIETPPPTPTSGGQVPPTPTPPTTTPPTTPAAPTTPATPVPTIPRTGSETGAIQTMALGFLLAGFVLFGATRRRREDEAS